MRSLEGRLHLGLGISLVLLIGAAWWLGHRALHHTADAFVISRLEHDAEGLLGALSVTLDGTPQIGAERVTPVYDQPYSGHYFVIAISGGEVLRSRSLWDEDLQPPVLQAGETTTWRAPGPADQRLLAWAGGYHIDDRDLVIVIAEDLSPLSGELQGFEQLFAIMAVGGLALILLIQRLVVHHTFTRLEPVYRDIERLEHGKTLFLTEEGPTEIRPLVRKLNRLLLRFDQRLERSRTAAGNLAHAIKGPLSMLRQQLQDPGLSIAPAQREALLDQIERLRRLAERQLKRARLAGAGGAGVSFEAAEELPTLACLLTQIHAPKPVDLQLDDRTQGPLNLDREDMLELLGNLLDNACKWAGARVCCELEIAQGHLILCIEDDGPGCSEEALAAITGRGVRLDEEVSGHGLGLSIVKEIVDSYQGRIGFARSARLGGLRAEVELPLGEDA
ncbi:GHKL domain-containing protein [Thiorhodococcus mannitoliphagus]|uniref:histidine kinase n=1 Tax=Thiorhodococcus mannitoliphagus TaxID=329406 RepID=A0A6P1E226_9GAMM|nr:ATP-binding protein [Thiorhodococcus mannitoliphagus]NEX22562.1 GHKL domain-containing protein [Thiorhodococcus mannitoliphagus]